VISSLRVASSFEEDDDPGKLNLSIHGFREDNGRIFIPPTVRYAEKSMRNENILAQEALPIQGRADFIDLGVKFAYGADTLAYRNRKVSCPIPYRRETCSSTADQCNPSSLLDRCPPSSCNFHRSLLREYRCANCICSESDHSGGYDGSSRSRTGCAIFQLSRPQKRRDRFRRGSRRSSG